MARMVEPGEVVVERRVVPARSRGSSVVALAILAAWFFYFQPLTAQHRHPDAEYLACAQMAMRDLGLPEKFLKSIHKCMVVLENIG